MSAERPPSGRERSGSAPSVHAHAHEEPAGLTGKKRSVPRRIVLAPVFGYRRFISPMLQPSCRFEPSCSAYAVQAVDQFGILRGLVLAIWRVARCNPFGGSGLDRPADQRIFPLFSRTKRQAKS